MSSHVSILFKSRRFRCCSFPLCFSRRIFNILVESLQRKQTYDVFIHLTILTKLKRWEITVINEIINMDFENDIPPNYASILEIGVKTKNKWLFVELLHSFLDKNSVNERAPFPRVYASLVSSLRGNEQ